MRRTREADGRAESVRPPSREEIETLCFLHIVGTAGCRVEELAARLGVSTGINDALARCADALSQRGLVVVDGEMVNVSSVGRDWMQNRLAGLGIRS